MKNEFDGQVALVTGITGGIGLATAKLLVMRGARVVLCGRGRDRLLEIQNQIGASSIAEIDLADQSAIPQAIESVYAREGRIDILANVAGIFPARMVADLDEAHIESLLAINLHGAISLSKAVVSKMTTQGSGSIVHVSSLASEKPVPGLSVYAATKAGLDAFSKSLAHEVAPNIRVNIVAPGPTRTASVEDLMAKDTTGAASEVTRDIPMGRLAEPEEIAEAIIFLASNRASFITGAVLHVNGGSLMS